MRPILWTPQAAGDLEKVPQPVRERVLSRIETLARFPEMGPAMDGPFEGLRELLVGRYRILYQVTDTDVRIAYIRHGARQLGLRLIRGGR